MSEPETTARRYEALKAYLLKYGVIVYHEVPVEDSEPFVMATEFYGSTFEEAVDTLD
jgi:hypothetical protein